MQVNVAGGVETYNWIGGTRSAPETKGGEDNEPIKELKKEKKKKNGNFFYIILFPWLYCSRQYMPGYKGFCKIFSIILSNPLQFFLFASYHIFQILPIL